MCFFFSALELSLINLRSEHRLLHVWHRITDHAEKVFPHECQGVAPYEWGPLMRQIALRWSHRRADRCSSVAFCSSRPLQSFCRGGQAAGLHAPFLGLPVWEKWKPRQKRRSCNETETMIRGLCQASQAIKSGVTFSKLEDFLVPAQIKGPLSKQKNESDDK